MLKLTLVVIFYFCCALCVTGKTSDAQLGEKKLSKYVMEVLDHYKQKNPVGLPGAPIPDPLDIPPMSHAFSVGTMHFENVKLYGLSKFRIQHIKADLAAMQVDAALRMDVLNVYGNYTLKTWLSKSQGPFTVQLVDVYVQAIAKLDVESEGKLEAQEMNMDITFQHIAMNFERLGFLASVFQGVINSVGSFLFDSIKPFILSEVNTNMRKDINKQVKTFPQTFPNSISPFDQIVTEARRYVRSHKYDPFKVDDYNYTSGIFGIKMTHTWLTGLSSFHREGNMTFEIKNDTVFMQMEIGTQRLKGSTHWETTVLGGILSRVGTASFSVEYLKVEVSASQAMDTRKKPSLDDLQIEMGNMQVRCDGAGTLDYVLEFAINILPNLLRYQIMDALETPIKTRIQESLNAINVEKVIRDNLAQLDEQQQSGFKGFLNK